LAQCRRGERCRSVLDCEQNAFAAGNPLSAWPRFLIREQSGAVVGRGCRSTGMIRPWWGAPLVSPAQRRVGCRVRRCEAGFGLKPGYGGFRARCALVLHTPGAWHVRIHVPRPLRCRAAALAARLGARWNFRRSGSTDRGSTCGVYRRSRHHGGPSCQAQHHQEEEEQVPSRAERPQDHCAGAPPHPHASPCSRD